MRRGTEPGGAGPWNKYHGPFGLMEACRGAAATVQWSCPANFRSGLPGHAAPHGGGRAVDVQYRVGVPLLDRHHAGIDQVKAAEEPRHLLVGTEGHLLSHRLRRRLLSPRRDGKLIAGRVVMARKLPGGTASI